jgi:hypothetical protein
MRGHGDADQSVEQADVGHRFLLERDPVRFDKYCGFHPLDHGLILRMLLGSWTPSRALMAPGRSSCLTSPPSGGGIFFCRLSMPFAH